MADGVLQNEQAEPTGPWSVPSCLEVGTRLVQICSPEELTAPQRLEVGCRHKPTRCLERTGTRVCILASKEPLILNFNVPLLRHPIHSVPVCLSIHPMSVHCPSSVSIPVYFLIPPVLVYLPVYPILPYGASGACADTERTGVCGARAETERTGVSSSGVCGASDETKRQTLSVCLYVWLSVVFSVSVCLSICVLSGPLPYSIFPYVKPPVGLLG